MVLLVSLSIPLNSFCKVSISYLIIHYVESNKNEVSLVKNSNTEVQRTRDGGGKRVNVEKLGRKRSRKN